MLIALSLTTIEVKAQQYHLHHFNDKDVIPSSFVYKTFEDSKGYLWFLTDKSITRYDGRKAKMFGPEDGYNEGGAYQILQDKKGVIWIVTTNFKLYYFKDEQFNELKYNKFISWLCIDKNDTKWIATRTNACISFIREDYTVSKPVFIIDEFDRVNLFLTLSNFNYLISLPGGIFHYQKGKIRKLSSSDTYNDFLISRIFHLKNRIYITNEQGIHEFIGNKLVLRYPPVNSDIFDLVEDDNGFIWVATPRGLLKLSRQREKFKLDLKLLTGYSVLSISYMHDKSLWVSTAKDGVFILNDRATHYTSSAYFSNEPIFLAKKDLTRMYFFTENINYYELYNNKLLSKKLPVADYKQPFQVKNALSVSNTGVVLFTTKELFIKDGKVGFFDAKKGKHASFYAGGDESLLIDEQLNLKRRDTIVINKDEWQNINRTYLGKNILTESACPILLINDTFFYSTNKGLLKVFKNKGKLYGALIRIKGIISGAVYHNQKIYVSTKSNGIYRINKGIMDNISTVNGLVSNYCTRIYIHGDFLWACTNKGVSRVNMETLAIRNFTERDYLLNEQVNDLEIFHDTVYVATNLGVTMFPANTSAPNNQPAIYLEKLLLNNSIEIAVNSLIETDYLNNNFTLELVSPGYRSGKSNRFRLIITTNDVTDTLHYDNSSIQLLALMPGTYNIRADVMNIDGVWSTKPVLLDLLIHPPFWKTIWFISLIIIIVCSVVGYVLWLSVKRQKEMQEYRRKITESELKSLRLYMNPHFLFNSLTSLQSFILTVKTGEANHFITKFSKLIRAVMNYSVKGELLLKEEIQLLKDYLELESVRFGTGFTYQVACQEGIDIENTSIPSLIIQPFVENAIKHGVTGVAEQCYIKVWFEMRGKELYCIVADNGKGRNSKQNKETTHISSGIKFTRERITLLLHNKHEQVITMTDTDPGNPLMPGTTVEIHVPVLNDQNDDE